jgi:hypothetical protein
LYNGDVEQDNAANTRAGAVNDNTSDQSIDQDQETESSSSHSGCGCDGNGPGSGVDQSQSTTEQHM